MANKGLEEYHKKLKAGLIKKTRDKNRPSAIKAIREKCLDCICAKSEGRIDCQVEDCSLYYFMPYGRLKNERKSQKANQKKEQDAVSPARH
ncbi:MAG: hypothetical protein UR21_C0024G0008 [Candidatus Woesebacteria bacterium GW2011_GWC2_31_9]|uniref:Uncharacterized protein n=1 Tax=Candidatus Woesebacteria bacterium GW2011_GWC2_31_9 TaxID=1618586 RepID=A0A0G0AW13_9BACT|nr:MAG: hypothetical protein UR21_C0024G0008 [Candidatus Woesebacteria bacterium GW2011_GWC2_31_9]